MAGESGHRNHRPGDSRPAAGDGVALLKSTDRATSGPCRDAVRTSCLRAVTGAAKLNLDKGGEAGVVGVESPGDPWGGMTLGSW